MKEESSPIHPFTCSYSTNVPALLLKLNCSIAISTYQAGKVVFLSPRNAEKIIQLPRSFVKAMGVAVDGNKMAIACKDEVLVLVNSSDLAAHYPKKPGTYDAMFMPRSTYHTGPLDIHDLEWCNGKLVGINTLFSCIIEINENYSFTPIWKPSFISHLASEDRCHLNGMTLKNGRPKYVSAFNQGNSPQSWREEITTGGVIIDVDSNEIVAANLPMPHSPRLYGKNLYVLLSATGELVQIDMDTGKYETIIELNGFVSGLAKHGDYVFVGMSKIRKNSSTFSKLAIAEKATFSGIKIIHLPTASLYGEIRYEASVDEIYDVKILPNLIRPGILNTLTDDHKLGLTTPRSTYWALNKEKKNG